MGAACSRRWRRLLWCAVGVDLAEPIHVSRGFCRLWFSASEQRWLSAAPAERATSLWAIKEAIHKAALDGEAWNPRAIEIDVDARGQFRATHRGRPLDSIAIDMQTIDGHAAAIVRHTTALRTASRATFTPNERYTSCTEHQLLAIS